MYMLLFDVFFAVVLGDTVCLCSFSACLHMFLGWRLINTSPKPDSKQGNMVYMGSDGVVVYTKVMHELP